MKPRKDYVYLDHNATSVVRPEVCSEILSAYQMPYNPSSTHSVGRYAKSLLGKARKILAQQIDAENAQIFFTSGATESNNIVLKNPAWEQIFCSDTEHDSIYNGPITQTIPVLLSGLLDLEFLKKLLESNHSKKTLVSVHWANNETGIIQPISEISHIVHHYGAWLHVDGAQALGKIPVSFEKENIDFLSLSAHKMGGPQGVGALISKKNVPLSPLFFGGGQEYGLRPGTENIPGIIGFGESIKHIDLRIFENLRKCHRQLEEELTMFGKRHNTNILIIGQGVSRLPNTTCITMGEVSNQFQLIYFDLEKIGVSIGSACASGTVKPSRVLKIMGFSEDVIGSSIRVSSGWNTLSSDFEKFEKSWKALCLRHS